MINAPRILVTGATGNVGSAVLALLVAAGASTLAAVRSEGTKVPSGARVVRFDFHDPGTFSAFGGVERVFLMRPPEMSNARRDLGPAISAMKAAGVRQVVFLSLLGAEKNPVVPHHAVEQLLRESGMDWVFLRPSFFMQNLSTTHRDDIKDRHDVFVPAGKGRTSFIDVRDLAAVGAKALLEGHRNVAYPLTGDEALSYDEVAHELSRALNRTITYSDPSAWRFYRAWRKRGEPRAFIVVMLAIYTTAKLGLAAKITDDTRRLLGRPAITFRQFAHDERRVWL